MPSLSLVLIPPHLQRLHDALACLGRFSEYVTIEASRNKLSLTALNSSKSAHGLISLLGGRFFDTYHFVPTQGRSLLPVGTEAKFTCRLLTKALLSVFRQRYLDSKDKETAIEKCEVTLGDRPTRGECRLLVRLICKHGVVKTYKLNYEDADIMNAIFNKASAPNHWRMNARLLKEHMEHFGPKAEQLDIFGEDGRATFTSFTEKLMDGIEILKQPLHTAVSMDTVEFEDFNVEEGLHITVNLKDFKAIVNHSDSMNVPIATYYSEPGRPLQIQYDRDGMNCEFTLTTIGGNVRSTQVFTRAAPRQREPPLSQEQRTSNMGSRESTPQHEVGPSQVRPDSLFQDPPDLQPRSAREEESLFIGDDYEDSPMGDDNNHQNHDEDVIGWDVNMDNTRGPRAVLQDRQQPPRTEDYYDDEDEDYEEMDIVGPTQQVSQARGLFD